MSEGIFYRPAQTGSRKRGIITEWNDDRGFGFVTPNDAGPRVFVHISAFARGRRRPRANDKVTYAPDVDAQGRPRGAHVSLIGEPSRLAEQSEIRGPGLTEWSVALAYLAFMVACTVAGRLPVYVPVAYVIASCATYVAYAFDKAAAMQNKFRTRENSLHVYSLLGGWPGALLAQQSFRHKTQKKSFRTLFWMTVLVNCAFTGWVVSPVGMRVLKALM